MWRLSAATCPSDYKTKMMIDTRPALTVPGSIGQIKVCAQLQQKHRNSFSFAWIQNCQKKNCLYLWILIGPYFLTIFDTSKIQMSRAFPSCIVCIVVLFTSFFLLCVEGWCLPPARWLLTLPLPPYPQTPIDCAGLWFQTILIIFHILYLENG
jgi:hypothetical protein